MLLLFFIFTFFCPSSNKILVKEAKVSPITQGNVAMTFYIVVENVSNSTYSISTKMTRCCEDISKNEKDCKLMSLLGGESGNIPAGVTRKILLLYPNMYSHNRKGQCTISVKAVDPKNKKEITVNTKINFNTYLRHLKSIKGLRKCKSRDLDPYQDCNPVDCTMKYLGTRNFFNSRRKRCQIVPTCLTNPEKQLPDVVYVPRSNTCRNLDKCVEAKDIKYLDYKKNDNNKPTKGFSVPTNVRCHQGILDPDSGFCKCKPGWTSVPMNKDLFEPSLFQFHMCNMRVSSWNDVNNKKIKLTLILIAVFGVIVSIFIILFSFLLSIVYRCLNSGQEPITIFGNGTGSTSCSKRTDATTIKTPRTSASSCMDSRSPQSRKSFCSCSKSVCSAQSRQPNPPDTCQDKEQDALSKSSPDLYENKNPCNVIEKECLPRKKQKRKCCEDKQKENCPRSDDLSLTSSQTREQKCENYLPTLECNSKLTWSKYKWILSKKSCSSSACPSQKPCKKKAPKPKRKKCKRKCKPKKCKKPQIEEQTAKEKCETFLRNLKSTDSIPSLVGSSCSSLYRESTSCKSVKKKKSKNVSSKKKAQKCDCATSFTSVISSEDDCQDKGNTSLYIMNEIQKDQTPTISLESTKKSNSEKQPFHVFHSKQVHRVENQNVLEIINKLIENATPNRKTNRHYCSEPPCSISNTDITWGSSFESKSVTTDAQNNTKTKEMSNGKTSSTSIFGKRPNFHLMEMIELQLTSEHDDEETHADEEAKPIVEVESLKPIVETLNITRPQDFSTSDTSNFTPLDECKEIHLSFGTAAELTQKKRRKIPFLHHKKYSKISTSSTSSSQRCSPKSIKSKRRKSKSTSKNLQENIPLCSQRKDKVFQLLSSSEDTENSNLETKSKRQTKFYGLKNKFRKYLFTNGKEKIPDPANASSWTSFKETVSSTSHNKTLNDISNVPNTSREDTPSKLQNTVEDNSNKESPIRTPKTTNIPVPVSSTLVNKSSSTTSPSFSPRSCKIPGPIFSKRSPKQQKSSSPGPSSRFYVDPDYTNAQNTKAEPK